MEKKNRYDKNLFAWNYVIMFCIQFIAILVLIGTYEPGIKIGLKKKGSYDRFHAEQTDLHQAREVTAMNEQITVGVPCDPEGRLVAEIYAKALQNKGAVVDKVYFKEGESLYAACREGRIEVYPQYILPAYRKLRRAKEVGNVFEEVRKYFLKDSFLYTAVKDYYGKHGGIDVLIPAPFNAGKGMVMTKMISKRYGIRTISQLSKEANFLRYVKDKNMNNLDKSTDNSNNQLTEVYGNFYFQSEKVFQTDVCYFVMKTHFGDVMEMNQTNPIIAKEGFIRLVDDKVAYLSNQVSPAVNHNTFAAYPEIKTILEDACGSLTTSVVTELMEKVVYENRDYDSVVNDYFESKE